MKFAIVEYRNKETGELEVSFEPDERYNPVESSELTLFLEKLKEWQKQGARLFFSEAPMLSLTKDYLKEQIEPYCKHQENYDSGDCVIHTFNVGFYDTLSMMAPFLRSTSKEDIILQAQMSKTTFPPLYLYLRLMGLIDKL